MPNSFFSYISCWDKAGWVKWGSADALLELSDHIHPTDRPHSPQTTRLSWEMGSRELPG